jgi:hypothetical protein
MRAIQLNDLVRRWADSLPHVASLPLSHSPKARIRRLLVMTCATNVPTSRGRQLFSFGLDNPYFARQVSWFQRRGRS